MGRGGGVPIADLRRSHVLCLRHKPEMNFMKLEQ